MINKDRIKVAFVTWLFPKISETFVLNQITFLLDHDCEVEIFATGNTTKVPAKEDLYVETSMHPDVLKYGLLRRTTHATPNQIAKILKKKSAAGKIDIVYFQFSDLASIILEREEFNIPTITIFHDLPMITKMNISKLKNKFLKAFKKATFVLVISKFGKNELLKLGCPLKKIIVHPMGADSKIFRGHNRKDVPKEHISLAMIGRFVLKKGFMDGIMAVNRFSQRNPQFAVTLNIVGDGYLRAKLEKLAFKFKFLNIKFWGKLDQIGVVKVLRKTDIFICPSKTDFQGKREGLPVTLIEASLIGLPIVTTDNAAIPEISSCSRAIIVVREGSVIDLSKGIERVAQQYKYYASLAKKDRKYILKKYDINILGFKLMDIFNRAMQTNKLRIALKKFSEGATKQLGSKLKNITVVGSVARLESVSKFSDLDIIIIVNREKDLNRELFVALKKLIFEFEITTGIAVIPQIFSQSDFLLLVSPMLIKDYVIDGENLIGTTFLNKIGEPPLKKLEFDILKRMLFQRYLVRQKITSKEITPNNIYGLNKIALFLTKDYIWIQERKYPTTKSDIIEMSNKLLSTSKFKGIIGAMEDPVSNLHLTKNRNAWNVVEFIEYICEKATEILKNRYGKININTF